MKELIEARSNQLLYIDLQNQRQMVVSEIVILTTDGNYKFSKDKKVVRNDTVETFRFMATEKTLQQLLQTVNDNLTDIQKLNEIKTKKE